MINGVWKRENSYVKNTAHEVETEETITGADCKQAPEERILVF